MSERQIASAVDTTKPGVETEKEEDVTTEKTSAS
jgi:hypothetical protein